MQMTSLTRWFHTDWLKVTFPREAEAAFGSDTKTCRGLSVRDRVGPARCLSASVTGLNSKFRFHVFSFLFTPQKCRVVSVFFK